MGPLAAFSGAMYGAMYVTIFWRRWPFVTILGAMYGAIFLGQEGHQTSQEKCQTNIRKKRNKEHEKENEEQEEQGKQTKTARE